MMKVHTSTWSRMGVGGSNLGVIVGVRAIISKSTPFVYLAFEKKKPTHSYTWSTEMLIYSYTAFWFFVLIYCW